MKRRKPEEAFMQQVIDLARIRGWKIYHTRDSRKCVPGFPDLVLARECVLWAECKTDTGELTPEQEVWVKVLLDAGQHVYTWRPCLWPTIERILENGP